MEFLACDPFRHFYFFSSLFYLVLQLIEDAWTRSRTTFRKLSFRSNWLRARVRVNIYIYVCIYVENEVGSFIILFSSLMMRMISLHDMDCEYVEKVFDQGELRLDYAYLEKRSRGLLFSISDFG